MVSPGASLNVRPTPSTQGEPVYELPNNAIVDRIADVQGEWVGETDTWFEIAIDELAETGFVSSNYATCTTAEPPELYPPDGHWLPLECDTSATISQGNDGSFSHQGNAFYAFDFSIGVGTPLVAMADGIVIHRYAATGPGEPCYDGGGEECYPYANLVVLLHGDGFTSIYKHLSDVHVAEGEFVPRGHVVGLSGSSGYSTGPHAHVARQEDCGEANCQSVPLEFAEIGVPQTGDQVTSNNCP
jgi:murein DD-endopeptidase MepM/ murein hydrolase activator NlpD